MVTLETKQKINTFRAVALVKHGEVLGRMVMSPNTIARYLSKGYRVYNTSNGMELRK